MSTMEEMTSADWLEQWGPTGGEYNCSTSTFDVGCLDCTGSRDIRVAAFVQDHVFITREYFYERDTMCPQSEPSRSPVVIWGGVWVLTLFKICRNLNLRCKIYEAVDHNDSVEDSPVFRDVVYGVADIGLTTRLLTNTRIKSGNYSFITSPVYSEYSILLHKRFLSHGQTLTGHVFLGTFAPETWLVLVGVLVLLSGGLVLSERLRRTMQGINQPWKEIALEIFIAQITITFPDHLKSLLHMPVSTACFTTVSLLFSVIVTSAFCARIPFELTANRPMKAPFSNVHEFLLSDFELYGNAAVREILLASKKPEIHQLGQRVTLWKTVNNSETYAFMGRNTDKKEAFLIRKEDHALLANYSCNFMEAVPSVQKSLASGFWFPRTSNLFTEFNIRFTKHVQSGKMKTDIDYYTKQYVRSVFRRTNRTPEECLPVALPTRATIGRRALRMSDLGLPFIALATIAFFGILQTACEILYARKTSGSK